MEEEIWKSIINYEKLYKASTFGEIKRLISFGCKKERVLKSSKTRQNGYLQLTLCKNNVHKQYLVHKLILETFVGPCPEGMECCHNDGNKENNRIDNLRYDTHKNNMQDSIDNKTFLPGIKNPNAKLNEKQVRIIKWLLKDGYLTIKEIAKIFKISIQTIYHIKYGERWGDIK